jgi:hypothetical protein
MNMLPPIGELAPGFDQVHCCLDGEADRAETDNRLATYHHQQERFLFEVLRLGRLPLRNIIEPGRGAGRITRCLAKNYPSARIVQLDLDVEQIESARNRDVDIRTESSFLESTPRPAFDVAIAVEVFQTHPRTRVRAVVDTLSSISRYLVNIDWSEPWPWKTPCGVWCHEYQALYAEAGLNCATFLLPEKTNGMQQRLFIASKKMTPEMVRLMDKAEEDSCGF